MIHWKLLKLNIEILNHCQTLFFHVRILNSPYFLCRRWAERSPFSKAARAKSVIFAARSFFVSPTRAWSHCQCVWFRFPNHKVILTERWFWTLIKLLWTFAFSSGDAKPLTMAQWARWAAYKPCDTLKRVTGSQFDSYFNVIFQICISNRKLFFWIFYLHLKSKEKYFEPR